MNGEVKTDEILRELKMEMERHMPSGPIAPNSMYRSRNQWMKIPGQLGEVTHRWFYRLLRNKVRERTEGTIFYDSILFAALIFIYPLLVFLLSLLAGLIAGFWFALILFITLPFLAYCWVNSQPIKVQQKDTSDRRNRLKNQVEPTI